MKDIDFLYQYDRKEEEEARAKRTEPRQPGEKESRRMLWDTTIGMSLDHARNVFPYRDRIDVLKRDSVIQQEQEKEKQEEQKASRSTQIPSRALSNPRKETSTSSNMLHLRRGGTLRHKLPPQESGPEPVEAAGEGAESRKKQRR